jgi:LmbE family N-acetylglucosaminyl deacetylase
MEIDNWNKQNVNAIVVVAHPDDETVFMGGTILNHPNWNWKIVCVTYEKDSLRGKELQSTIKKYESLGISSISAVNLGVQDSYDSAITNKLDNKIKKKLKPELSGNYDIVFTHNSKGDYGHPQHVIINKIVNELADVPVWEFICLGAEKVIPAPFKKFIHFTVLDVQELERKLEVFKSYPSQISFFRDLPTIARYEFKTGPEIFVSDSRLK